MVSRVIPEEMVVHKDDKTTTSKPSFPPSSVLGTLNGETLPFQTETVRMGQVRL